MVIRLEILHMILPSPTARSNPANCQGLAHSASQNWSDKDKRFCCANRTAFTVFSLLLPLIGIMTNARHHSNFVAASRADGLVFRTGALVSLSIACSLGTGGGRRPALPAQAHVKIWRQGEEVLSEPRDETSSNSYELMNNRRIHKTLIDKSIVP